VPNTFPAVAPATTCAAHANAPLLTLPPALAPHSTGDPLALVTLPTQPLALPPASNHPCARPPTSTLGLALVPMDPAPDEDLLSLYAEAQTAVLGSDGGALVWQSVVRTTLHPTAPNTHYSTRQLFSHHRNSCTLQSMPPVYHSTLDHLH
jgi:hypothetical protein